MLVPSDTTVNTAARIDDPSGSPFSSQMMITMTAEQAPSMVRYVRNSLLRW